jgi:hypothetical protein
MIQNYFFGLTSRPTEIVRWSLKRNNLLNIVKSLNIEQKR